ncbi:non-ribosomal peptide synthase/polyketide synthase [Tumebacillus lipolyticus]|uniref:Non-ribosomal peptide synthase/polyketide synthase n=1 Tax=Tumebacillus lipolyticus TaxID=1280370 RepID=A0ABW4ZUF2_9BACL
MTRETVEKSRLDESFSPLQLPVDRARQTGRGQTHILRREILTSVLCDRLDRLCRTLQVDRISLLLTAFQTLLARYAGQEEFVIGALHGGERLALPVAYAGELTFVESVTRTTAALLNAKRAHDIFSNGVEVEMLPVWWKTDQTADVPESFELLVTIADESVGMTVSFEYQAELFESSTIERMIGHFNQLLAAAASDANAEVSRLPMLSEQERSQLLVEWNRTASAYPQNSTLKTLFEEQAKLQPDGVAVRFLDQVVSYAELNARANRLAHHLRKLGVGPNVLVGICVERSVELVVGLLGIVKAGGAYVPLDAEYPTERLAFMMQDTELDILVAQDHLLDKLPEQATHVVRLDADRELLAQERTDDLQTETTADDLVYVIYTSGTTGRPKGICIKHRGVVRLVKETNFFTASSEDLFLQIAPISFDAATFEIWGSLLNGAALLVYPPSKIDLVELSQLVESTRLTVLHLTAGLFNQMVDEHLDRLVHVRQLLTGGDALSVPHARRALRALPNCAISNCYGPTEVTMLASVYRMPSADELAETARIGRPIANTELYVLDQQLQPVPIGVAGELYVGGPGLAAGYLHLPEMTADRFVMHPFSQVPGERLYRTGDRVRYLPDGNIEFFGRIDQQVKVRGYRIELAEIEEVLKAHAAVQDAVVIVREYAAGDKRLLAYLVPSDSGVPTPLPELRAYVRDRLPEYMVPAALIRIESIPLTPNGKIDRKSLPEPQQPSSEEAERSRTPIEELVGELFAGVLGYQRVGLADDFFGLGGHSLLATQAISRLRAAFRIDLSLRDLFEAPSVTLMAERIASMQASGTSLAIHQVTATERSAVAPLSFSQQRMWFLNQYQPGNPSYNLSFALHLTGDLYPDALEWSLNELVTRHEALRTSFLNVDGVPMQKIEPLWSLPFDVIDLQEWPAEERIDRAIELAEAEAKRPFQLDEDSLIRAALLLIDRDEYVLLLNLHHIVLDGWSMEVFAGELSAIYSAFLEGSLSPLEDMSIQYADFARWQRQHLTADLIDRQLRYWKERLAGMQALQLPTDRPRPAVPSLAGAVHAFELSDRLTEALRTFSRREGVTLNMTLLAAFKTLLYRLSGADDIAVGSPVAGRPRPELESLIGCFVNTVVLRSDLSGELSFRELVKRVRETALDAYAHQDVPFEKVVAELQPGRDQSFSPLVQAMFQIEPPAPFALEDVTIEQWDVHNGTAKFDLYLPIRDHGDKLVGRFEYNTDIFDAATISRMALHFITLLEGIVAQPDALLWQLPLLTAAERDSVLQLGDRTETDYPKHLTIPQLFAAQVQATPDAIAVSYGDQSLTYRELNSQANRVAHLLIRRGVGADSFVGLCMERSVELIVAVLGIVKAGGAYVPFDASYPEERLSFLIKDSAVSILLTQEAMLSALPAHSLSVICFDRDQMLIAQESDENPILAITPDHLAYLNYTSGSTGMPKGVMINHRGVVRLVKGTDYLRFAEDEVFLHVAPISFDAATFEIWGALLNGAKLVVFPAGALTLDRLGEVLQNQGVSTLFLTAGLFHQMVEHRLNDLSCLRHLLTGGEVISPSHVNKVLRQLPDVTLFNVYGPTESTTFTTAYSMQGVEQIVGAVPIGGPIGNTTVYVLDDHLQPVPVGVPGELHIGGDGLARGYLNRPELTEEKFIADPFSADAAARLYKTGDLVRWMADGNLDFVGRIDDQVKIRGFRIELGEIEGILTQHEAVEAAAVLAREDRVGDKRLVAYVALAKDSAHTAGELRDYLSEKLPTYMIPSALLLLDELPLTTNGKVDRKRLPAPESFDSDMEYVAPRTALEEQMADIWAELLGTSQVGMTDNFFERGGHSLLAMQVLNRVHKQFGVKAEVQDLFGASTLERFTARVAELGANLLDEVGAEIPQAAIQEHYALSHAQKRLWVLYKLDPSTNVYHVPLSLILNEQVELPAFEAAVTKLIERHAILRTRFVEVEGVPRQVVQPSSSIGVRYEDLTALNKAEQQAHIERAEHACNDEPFDLTAGPLMRVMLFKLGVEQAHVHLNLHHIITDGWSTNILFKELLTLYRAELAGQTAELAAQTLRYVDYAEWTEREAERGAWSSAEEHWLKTLAKPLPLLELPLDHERPKQQTFAGSTRLTALPETLHQRLQQVAKAEQVSMNMLLFAAYFGLMRHLSKEEDIIIGMPIAGRTMEALEPLVGFLANTLAIRVRFGDEVTTVRQLLEEVKRQSLTAYQHQSYPFDLLVEKINPERDMSRPPIFSTVFGYHEGLLELDERATWLFGVDFQTRTSKFDLSLYAGEKDGQLLLNFEYNTDLFKAETIGRFGEMMVQMLEAFGGDLDVQLDELQILTDWDLAVYAQMNDTDVDWDLNQLLHEEFCRYADEHPDRIALIYEGETMTYGELHARSNSLAHFLRAQGVSRNQLIGIQMERSFELMIALYGVLKAGAAYVPIDPDYPTSRVQYMLTDSSSPVLITKLAYAEQIGEIAQGEELPLTTVLYMDAHEAVQESLGEGVGSYSWRDVLEYPSTTPEAINENSDVAYLIYTSGSTGKPKGVVIRHEAIVNRILWHQSAFQTTPEDCVIQRTTHCFDDSIIEFFWPLRYGARLLILPNAVYTDPERLVEQMVSHDVTYMQFVPSLLSILVAYLLGLPEAERPALKLRDFIVSGEPLPSKLVNQWYEMYPNGARIGNLYGATEAAVDSTAFFITGPLQFVHVGVPIANSQVYVFNRRGKLCPIGVKGEIILGGLQLAEGYHNKPEKTAEQFIPNHLPGQPGGARLYKTGDLGRILPDGTIECSGRVDNQVKVRGYRIELGEIEEVFSQHPDTEMVAVIVKKGRDGNNMLVGFYSATSADLEQAELKEFIGVQLPNYMVPAKLIQLDEMPLTPNGKVDRKLLEQMAQSEQWEEEQEFVAPSTPTEESLCQIWGAVLQREAVSASDHFFDLGGHSLLAIQVLNRIDKQFGVTLPLKDVFQFAMLQDMAAHLDRLLAAGKAGEAVEIARVADRSDYELSHAQKRMYILYKFHQSSKLYNVQIVKTMRGMLDEQLLRRAFELLVRRHDALRTVFFEVDDLPRQAISEQMEIPLDMHDLASLTGSEQQDAIRQIVEAKEEVPFDLERGPLVRALLFKRAQEEHSLYLNIHHIIIDGWSFDVLFRDLSNLYEALLRGEVPPAKADGMRYVDYAAWQHAELEAGSWQEHESYWLNQLAKPHPVLHLPTDYERPAEMTANGALIESALPAELVERLRTLCKREDVSMYMALMAGFFLLLHQLTGDEDLIVGTPVSGRNQKALEEIVGFFLNTLAIRVRWEGVQTPQDLLQQVKREFLAAHEHQSYPFDLLIEKLNPERDTSRTPLFSTMFALLTEGEVETAGNALKFQAEDGLLKFDVARFDLILLAVDTADAIKLRLEYNTDLFARESVERFHAIFLQALKGMATQYQADIGELDLLSAEDRLAYERLNDTALPYPELTIHQAFALQAAATPERPALSDEEHDAISYEQLQAQSNRVAHFLRERGVGVGSAVLIMMERSRDVVIAMLGVMKAGAAYVPIDPNYPQERIEYVLNDSAAQLVLTESHLRDRLQSLQIDSFELKEIPISTSAEPIEVQMSPDDLAYMIYTSGSTGLPKGTMISHRGVVSLAQWTKEQYAEEDRKTFLNYATHSFDGSVWEIYAALLHGSHLYVLSERERQSAELFAEAVKRTDAKLVFLPTAIFREFAMALPDDFAETKFRSIFFGGEAIQAESVRLWQERFGTEIELAHMYGPTEATVFTTIYRICEQLDPEGSSVPIGRPLANMQVSVRNKHFQLCPINVPGELYIEGVGLAKGYLNQPERTEEAFLRHPHHAEQRMYKTGDIVRLLRSGEIQFIGRRDSQVKVRGYRVELGEIEEALLQQPAVRSAMVVVRPDESGRNDLVAFYVPSELGTSARDLRSSLEEKLPAYMIPSQLVELAELPMLANGKVDRKALMELALTCEEAPAQAYVAPETEWEQKVAAIWSGIFHREQISRHDHFFELGGHSLLAIQFLNRVKRGLGLPIEMKDVFLYGSLREMAAHLASLSGEEQAGLQKAIQRLPEQEDYQLSHAQKRLWFIYQIDPHNRVYDVPTMVAHYGSLEVATFAAAWQLVVQRHESLRTIVFEREGEPRQKVIDREIPLAYRDLSALDRPMQDEFLRLKVEEINADPFDLTSGPLVRAILFKRGEEEYQLYLNIHHIVYDGWSYEVLFSDLAEAYQALLGGDTPEWTPLDVRYVEYAAWQNRELAAGSWRAHELFWLEELNKPLPVLELPTDFPRPEVMTFHGALQKIALPRELEVKLREVAKREETSMFMLMFAAYVTLLNRLTHADDIIVGTPVAGRIDESIEPLVGFFVNMLAIRTRTESVSTLQDVLAEVKERFLRAYEHQAYSFDLLVEKVNPDRDASRSPIFSTMFTLHAGDEEAVGNEQLRFVNLSAEMEHKSAKVDLSLFAIEQAAGMEIAFEYNTDLFAAETVEQFAALYQQVLAAYADRLTAPLGELELLTAKDVELYARLNDTNRAYDLDRTLPEMFYRSAHLHGSKIALSSEHGELTYRELNERSNQVAHLLRERGLVRGQFVSIVMERSIETVIALLGVLKAGGVYVPIDPDYPEARIRYMLGDCRAPYLLTDLAHADQLQTLLETEPELRVQILQIEEASALADTSDLPPQSEADDLAYLIYTSGSTGQPKGAQMAHRGVINLVLWAQEHYRFGADDVMLEFSSFSFDASVWDTFVGLLLGGRVHLLSKEGRLSAAKFAEEVQHSKATCVMLMVTFFKHLADHLSAEDVSKLKTLRMMHVGGELLTGDVLRKWQRKFGTEVQVINVCGPTETTVYCATHEIVSKIPDEMLRVPIGKPLANYKLFVVGPHGTLCPVNVPGEIIIESVAMSKGYLNQPETSARSFVDHPFRDRFGPAVNSKVYRSGDRGRLLPDGTLEVVGRIDDQVKVRGYRIEIGEIEAAILRHPAVELAGVIVEQAPDGSNALHGFYTSAGGAGELDLRSFLGQALPSWMVPARLTQLASMPLSPTGKVDRRSLSARSHAVPTGSPIGRSVDTGQAQVSTSKLQEQIAAIWADVLECDRSEIGSDDNFFDIGGHSLLLTKVQKALQQQLDIKLPILELFQHTTVRELAVALGDDASVEPEDRSPTLPTPARAEEDAVAIIGIGLRFPGAKNPYEYWQNLREGKELIRDVPLESLPDSFAELDEAERSRYVLREGWLEEIDQFDPALFQMTDREASQTDPQQRLFMLCSWEAIENAGYRLPEINATTSVFAGVSDTRYGRGAAGAGVPDEFSSDILTNRKFTATRLSYKLDLRGESVVVDSACSSSLTAVHLACQSLLSGQSDYALAGGISVQTPQKVGYLYEPGFILSPDGHCRAFDQSAEGTVPGNGVGVVLLKRLADAKRDGDPIYAVIKGSALNNDGHAKIGYTAPSQQGQAEVIARAQRIAGVDPSTITYIEAHGTGTNLGDPIELAALKHAFGHQQEAHYCAIGSVKSNIGHTDAAAGLAGLIKVALCMKYGELVPSLHFNSPNPACGFEHSPFYVNTEHKRWLRKNGPLRAGVSAFGIGGTNAHVIMEEAPLK